MKKTTRKKIVVFKEWLSLSNKAFRLLIMIAVSGGHLDINLSDMCRFLSISCQERNKIRLKTEINTLTSEGYINCVKKGNIYHLKIIPQKTKIKIFRHLTESIIKNEYTMGISVSWMYVLKLYIWIVHNKKEIVTCQMISNDINASISTLSRAKGVLERGYRAIMCTTVTKKLSEGDFITLGQTLRAGAWWSPPQN